VGVPEQREEIAAAIAKARGTNPGLEPVASRSDAQQPSGAESLLQAARQRAPSALHALLGSVPPPAPSAGRTSSAVGDYVERSSRALVVPGVTIVRSESTRWAPHPKFAGVHVRQLHRDSLSGLSSAMFKMDRGASLPERRHLAAEELVLIEGVATVGDWTLRSGDCLRAEPGTVSPLLRADEVCTLYVSGSENVEFAEET
jgi:anti-sigma factor ChrR (cupin superfamily)